jgi:hypothetical protein
MRLFFASVLTFSFSVAIVPANAETTQQCQQRYARACYEIEKNKPDSSRSGVSAAEFCAAAAITDSNCR